VEEARFVRYAGRIGSALTWRVLKTGEVRFFGGAGPRLAGHAADIPSVLKQIDFQR
jgi:hypothetical protein